ncbi:hypothetical protein Scep_016426 [Stephania cephalantha]|uniref:Uncharacterized protein n=1 Tax=Stephania cephalantha TaxID=152367 RepID=A0AAP0IMM3_9MAGN
MKYMGAQPAQLPSHQHMRFPPSAPHQQQSFYVASDGVPDTSWYADSGATSHIATDSYQMMHNKPYGGYPN